MSEQLLMFEGLPRGGGDKLVLRDLKLREHTAIIPKHFTYVQTDAQLGALRKTLERVERFSFDTETTGLSWTDTAVALGISTGDRSWWIPTNMVHAMRNFEPYELRDALGEVFESNDIAKVAHNYKFDMKHMLNTYGITVGGDAHDTALAQWVLNENESHTLEAICTKWLNHTSWKIKQDGSFNVWPLKMATLYLCHDAEATYELYEFQIEHLKLQPKLFSLMYELEMPTVAVMFESEQRGFAWDSEYYEDVMKPEVNGICDTVEAEIREYVGDINLNSPEQVASALFNGLHLPPHHGNSVDKKTLSALRDAHPVIPLFERFRKYSTLKKMFIDQLPAHVHNGRIHPTSKTIGAKTGRMACVEPNLQQLPKQTVGPLVRRAFIPTPGCVLIAMDYSQIELRILAHLSGDPELIAAFERGDDIHMAVTSRVFGIAMDELKADKKRTQENPVYVTLRVIAKTINFGILYGMGAALLMETINDRVRPEDRIDLKRAQELIDQWFAAYPKVQKYIYKMGGLAEKFGYVETILGRKRRLPDAQQTDNFQAKSYAQRQAANAPIQGSAADMIKLALLNVHERIIKENWPYHLLLTVHDELILEVPVAWLKANTQSLEVLKLTMRDAVKLIVPVEVSLEVLTRWGDRFIDEDDIDIAEAV